MCRYLLLPRTIVIGGKCFYWADLITRMSPERNWHRFTSRRLERAAIILHLMTCFADSFIHQHENGKCGCIKQGHGQCICMSISHSSSTMHFRFSLLLERGKNRCLNVPTNQSAVVLQRKFSCQMFKSFNDFVIQFICNWMRATGHCSATQISWFPTDRWRCLHICGPNGRKKFLKVGHIFSLGVCWRTWAAAMTMRAAGSLEFHHTKQHFRGYFKNYFFK